MSDLYDIVFCAECESAGIGEAECEHDNTPIGWVEYAAKEGGISCAE